ncbi:MAG: sigma-54-dependent Fis family transcriptional regulator [Deltaproteobacteria bacterium]|nr:sigma-54-dependent Fis family transcriptional regulator [Deltaproteobacteria bacterium]
MSPPLTLLIVDDDEVFADAASRWLGGPSLAVLRACTAADARSMAVSRHVDLILLDEKLPDGLGHQLCPELLAANEGAKIIFMTAFPSVEHAVRAVRAGATDYVSKPCEPAELKLVVSQACRALELERVEARAGYRSSREKNATVLLGEGLAETRRLVDIAATTQAPVLVTGETGTGKNVVAKAIHFAGSARRDAFGSINTAAFPENLIVAELCGYERGAFTGAVASSTGIFEMAEGGTLVLDEIGEMPLHLQAKLLSVLEDKVIKRLGGTALKPVDARVIATTNADLESAIARKAFREDLFYRLSVIRIHVPPLRQRPQDIPELCRHFLRTLGQGTPPDLPETELAALQAYPWPGNVRELRNVIERALLLRRSDRLAPSELLGVRAPAPREDTTSRPTPSHETLEQVEQRYISQVLGECSGNLSQAARRLGIALSTLKRRLKTPEAPQ